MIQPSTIPPEWAPQSAVWVGWPRLADEWGGLIDPARQEIAEFVKALAAFVPVRFAVGDDAAAAAAHRVGLGDIGEIHRIPTGDIWLRDTGPVFGTGAEGLIANVFGFNGWGGKFLMDGDAETASAIAKCERAIGHQHGFVLEGGAIDVDGEGTVLTTTECLLNPNRNGPATVADVETRLERSIGARRIIWIDRGLINDHTDGHVDNIARFVAPGHVVCQRPSGADDPHAERLAEIEETLRRADLIVTTVPSPGRITNADGEVLPASHMNFLITNGAVLVPVYEDQYAPEAIKALATAIPIRKIVPLSAIAICAGGGGAYHCMTRDVPAI